MTNSFNNDSTSGDPGKNSDNSQGTFSQQSSTDPDKGSQGGNDGNDNSNIDVQTLQKRVNDSQAFIQTLKDERIGDRDLIQNLQDELKKRPSLEEIMEHINQNTGNTDKIDPEALVNQAVEAMDARTTAKEQLSRAKNNIDTVSKELSSAFAGEDIDKKVAELATENDMTFEEVFDLASKNPKAALKVLGITQKGKPSSNGVNSTINTQAMGQQPGDQNKDNPNIMQFRTDKERVAFFNERMSKGLKQLT